MPQIRNDVTLSGGETKVCSKCDQNKPIEEFSLARGKHSSDRKSYCVKCEGLARKARKKYGLEMEAMKKLLEKPCSVCGGKSKHIDKSGDRINGVLCSRCWSFLKTVLPNDEADIVTACQNYLVFREQFPFWFKMESGLPEPPSPLLDFIEANSSDNER